MASAVKLPPIRAQIFQDFAGGLNIRDAPTELEDNETPAARNVSFEERGGVSARLGVVDLNAGSRLPSAATSSYYSGVCGALLAYLSADGGFGKLYKSLDGGTNWSAVKSDFTTGAQADMVDFAGKLVFVNTLDGVYVFPADLSAPTHTAGGTANMEEIRGSSIEAWQNKVWVAGEVREDATHSRTRLYWSKEGDATVWTIATDFNDFREVDNEPLTKVGAGQGFDAQAKPTLLVCKLRSVYRVNDSQTGAYQTLMSAGAGAASAHAIASSLGGIAMMNDLGVWATDGVSLPVRLSDKIQPLFTAAGINLASLATIRAGLHGDAIVFSLARAGSSHNDLLIEFHPTVGWFAVHLLGSTSPFGIGPMSVVQSGSTRRLIGFDSNAGNVYALFEGGTDAGQPFHAYWQSRYYAAQNVATVRLRRLRAYGRGQVDMTVLTDFTRGSGDLHPLDFTGDRLGFIWNTDKWNLGAWGAGVLYEGHLDEPLDEVCQYVAFRAAADVSSVTHAPPLLDDGHVVDAGPWGLYLVRLDYVPLGLT